MTQEEKDIIYKDACCRLPYRPYAAYTLDDGTTVRVQLTGVDELAEYYGYISDTWGRIPNFDIKLYLRSLSSMTGEEKEELRQEHLKDEKLYAECITRVEQGDNSMRGKVIPHFAADWCNKHHFDYRGLIEKGLAIEAPESMYNIKTK